MKVNYCITEQELKSFSKLIENLYKEKPNSIMTIEEIKNLFVSSICEYNSLDAKNYLSESQLDKKFEEFLCLANEEKNNPEDQEIELDLVGE